MRYFATTTATAQAAIQECFQSFTANQPPVLNANQGGPTSVFTHGNGRWFRDGNSYYYNCGVNEPQEEGEIQTPEDSRATLSNADMNTLAQWFGQTYQNTNVLSDGTKRNFTAVANGRAFNFHLVVA